jgi:hypothetical protein
LSETVLSYLKKGDTCYEGEIWMGDQGKQIVTDTLALLKGETLTKCSYAKNYPVNSDNVNTYYQDYYANK